MTIGARPAGSLLLTTTVWQDPAQTEKRRPGDRVGRSDPPGVAMWIKTLVAVAVVLVAIAGCAEAPGPVTTTSDSSPLPSCGRVPTSTGPAARLVTLRLESSVATNAGASVPVTARIDVHHDGPRIITRPTTSRILVTQGDSIVGGSSGSREDQDIPVVLTAGASRPAQALPTHVTLSRCLPGSTATGAALPPGTYGLVAVLSYGQDPLQNAAGGGSRSFQLVSKPTTIVIR